MFLIGTSGYSYDDWRGAFYPPKLDKRDFLSFYAGHFQLLELNSSYYAIPSPALVDNLIERTGADFRVVVKAFKGITHERGPESAATMNKFLLSIEPLREAGKLEAILLQFPFSFHFGEPEMQYLESVLDALEDYAGVVEFRNAEWRRKRVWSLLRARGTALCCVDGPGLPGLPPPEVVRTCPELGYVRFHGRNAEKWWEHEHDWERYHYDYSPEELEQWRNDLLWLESNVARTLILFNNHRGGNAVKNARMMARMLGLFENGAAADGAVKPPADE